MLALKVKFRDAEDAKAFLHKRQLYESRFLPSKDASHIYFPSVGKTKLPFEGKFVSRTLAKREAGGSLRQLALKEKMISKNQMGEFVSSFDVMGNIAIVEIPPEFEGKEKRIAELLMRTHPNVKTVAKKTSAVKGKYRVKSLEVIAGKKTLVTEYRENNCRFRLDLGKVYFSPRLSFERNRIARKVRKGERVLALFAGAGFYPIIIEKIQPGANCIAIELNPIAEKYMEENIRLNKMEGKIKSIRGDVNRILTSASFKRWATRAIMPLPHSAYEFLPATITACMKGAVVHFYYIPKNRVPDAFIEAEGKIREACVKSKRKYKVIFKRSVKTYAPGIDEVVVDFKLLN
ncbi:MAG: class I SAM-dependent methyltransferase family protein [Candidatus Micrarchaeota archaeon]